MSVIRREPQSNTSPNGSGEEFDSHDNTSGEANVSAVGTPGGGTATQTKTCLWNGFENVSGQIVEKRIKFDWTLSGEINASIPPTLTEQNSASAQYSLTVEITGASGLSLSDSVSVAGDGPRSDGAVINEGGSFDQIVPASTAIPSIQVEAELQAQAQAAALGQGNVSLNLSISNIRLEITLADVGVIVLM